MSPFEPVHTTGVPSPNTFDRRSFLNRAGSAALLLGSTSLLSARSGTSPRTPAALGAARPKVGGTLRAGLTGGGSADTLNPFRAVTNTDFARVNNLFDPLVRYNTNAEPELWLAEEISPNKDFTRWIVRVRPGIFFHNGKPLTAEDIIYTLRTAATPGANSSSLVQGLDVTGLRQIDRLTAEVPFKAPFASFVGVLLDYWFNVVPAGYDFKTSRPVVGTGPFVLRSFVPGQESVFVRNESYWRHGHPYVDSLVISDFPDESSQTNAIESGNVDVVNGLSAPSIAVLESAGEKVAIDDGGSFSTFVMNTEVAPFNDVRVRQALRLLVNRKQMRDIVFQGHGVLGNDVFSIFDPVYDHALPQREQNVSHARSLLRQAGHANLSVELVIANVGPGIMSMATVLAQQATAAGVTITLREVTPSALYGPNYTKWPFAVNYWYNSNYFPQVLETTLPTASQPETRFNNRDYTRLFYQAQKAPVHERTLIAHKMQLIDFEEGGYIIPFFLPVISGLGKQIYGDPSSKVGIDFNNWDFQNMWKG